MCCLIRHGFFQLGNFFYLRLEPPPLPHHPQSKSWVRAWFASNKIIFSPGVLSFYKKTISQTPTCRKIFRTCSQKPYFHKYATSLIHTYIQSTLKPPAHSNLISLPNHPSLTPQNTNKSPTASSTNASALSHPLEKTALVDPQVLITQSPPELSCLGARHCTPLDREKKSPESISRSLLPGTGKDDSLPRRGPPPRGMRN